MRFLKWAVSAVGVVVILGVLVFGFVYVRTQSRIQRRYEISADQLVLAPRSEEGAGRQMDGLLKGNGNGAGNEEFRGSGEMETLAWGEHIAVTRGCIDCHGKDLGGGVFADAMPVFRLWGSNLTAGGVGKTYSDADWVRAIRHGVGPDGRSLLLMPSYEYYLLSDGDLSSLIAYIQSLPAVDRDLGENQVGPLGRVLFASGKLPLLAAELIDHDAPRPVAPPRGATVEYGAYLAVGCTGCHGEGFSGGMIPGVPPEWPPAANITPDPESGLGSWTREDFFRAMREGKRPDGTDLRAEFMPWTNMAGFKDDELEALWMYLESVAPKTFGGR
jgi:mono/diheme cytochrome c family protein